jgi:hypothetical protein
MATIMTLYKQPQLAELALDAMQHEGFHFYIHIDKKVDADPYKRLLGLPNVFLVKKRISIGWAGYSMAEALLAGMEQALQSGIDYDFINHISGQCFPVKPVNTIYNFFDQHKGKNFLQCDPLPSEWWNDAKTRYENYHLNDFNFKGNDRLAIFLTNLLPKRKLPFNYTMYGGPFGAYWTITKDTAAYLVNYINSHNKVRRFFRKTWGPDEFLFNTVIMNSEFRHITINNNFRYIDWSLGGANPKILTVSDYEKIKESDCFFARKFDLTKDGHILELIKDNLLS